MWLLGQEELVGQEAGERLKERIWRGPKGESGEAGGEPDPAEQSPRRRKNGYARGAGIGNGGI